MYSKSQFMGTLRGTIWNVILILSIWCESIVPSEGNM